MYTWYTRVQLNYKLLLDVITIVPESGPNEVMNTRMNTDVLFADNKNKVTK